MLLLVLVCQLLVATIVGILAERFFGAWGVAAAIVFEIVVIFVLAEALPKNWAVHNPERSGARRPRPWSRPSWPSRRCGSWPAG